MTTLRVALSRFVGLFGARRREKELAEEVQAHLDLIAEENRRRGMSPKDARAAARREFGGVEQMKERYRDQWHFAFVDGLRQDLRFGARLLVKDRWFALAAVIGLALGIGASNTVFTVMNAMNLSGPGDDPGRIMTITTRNGSGGNAGVSFRDYQDWRAATRTFEDLAGGAGQEAMTVTDAAMPADRLIGLYISANMFHLLRERPILGRDFLPEDDRPDAAPTVMLEGGVWRRRYGSDPGIIGRSITIDGVPSTVIGVMREGFMFPAHTNLWLPLGLLPGIEAQPRDARTMDAVGRLADDVGRAQAEQELSTIAAGLARDYPDTNRGIQPRVRTFGERFGGSLTAPIPLTLMATAGFVLLIACANVANLLLARAAPRVRELSIRAATGATRPRIVRQLLVESALLAIAAGTAGLLISRIWVRQAAWAVEQSGVYWMQFDVDGRVLAFLIIASLSTIFLFGLAPALHVSGSDLSGGSRGVRDNFRTRRWTTALLVSELALTMVLLTGAGLIMRSFLVLYRADQVIEQPSQVLRLLLGLPSHPYAGAGERAAFYQRLEERLAANPALAATMASTGPFNRGGRLRLVSIDGRPAASSADPGVPVVLIGPRYFDVLRLRLLAGRDFTTLDGTPGHDSAIVNQRAAAMFFPGENPIGRRVRLTDPNPAPVRTEEAPDAGSTWLTIVGISPTVRQTVANEAGPVVYLPFRVDPLPGATLLVRGQSDQTATASLIREEVRALDPDLALSDIRSLEDMAAISRMQHSLFGTMLGSFAVIGLVLSAVGLYAVTAYGVIQRTPEIGIRVSLGARSTDVRWLFLKEALRPLGVALVLGLIGALGVGMVLQSLLIQTPARDPVTLTAIVVILLAVALTASIVPAWEAARVDPMVALRCD